jgi:hypothetical protein
MEQFDQTLENERWKQNGIKVGVHGEPTMNKGAKGICDIFYYFVPLQMHGKKV